MTLVDRLLAPFRRPTVARSSPARGVVRDTRIDCELRYETPAPTEFLFLLHAQDSADQQVSEESITCEPAGQLHVFSDMQGHRYTRLRVDAGEFTVRYRARVQRTMPAPRLAEREERPLAEIPDELLPMLLPTRYCESDLLGNAARKLFAERPPGEARVRAMCDWIHEHIDYQVGTSQPATTSRDVFVQRAGVCRDFAHLAITFCRALNIPARFTVGYAPFDSPPPDFHAVFEAWLDGEWVMFDPTRLAPVEDLVRIASGRDASEVAFANIFGPARMISMAPRIERLDAPLRD
jgi:transglutaminase-like putative cysteine protease